MPKCLNHWPPVDMRPSLRWKGGRGEWFTCPICEDTEEWADGRCISRYPGANTMQILNDLAKTEVRHA